MIIIKAYAFSIILSEKDSFAIYDDLYECDEHGNRTEDGTGEYDGLNIIIETNGSKYIMDCFSPSNDSSRDIVNYITEHATDDVIIVDLDEMVKKHDKDFGYDGTLKIESKKN
ncbi:MAG: hypothetical protein IKW90_12155 [Lachnospiraceae bacterium]|nr:hypothetical protein [Lachnospiraceae bacterium]